MQKDGTERHLASFCLEDSAPHLAGADDPAFTTIEIKYADLLGGAPPGLPPDPGIEVVLETGDVAAIARGEALVGRGAC